MALYGSRQRYVVNKPGQQRHEYLVSQALAVAEIPGEEIEKMVTPRAELFPPQLGYDDTPPTLDVIMGTAVGNPEYRAQTSGAGVAGEYTGTARPSGNEWF